MPSKNKTGVTGEDIRREILRKILNGSWTPGDRLPSCRQIAVDLGSNANTVNREIQRLATEGLVRSEPRKGTYVTGTSGATIMNAGLNKDVKVLARRARAMGLALEDIIELLTTAFSFSEQKVAFVECNVNDLMQMTTLIANATGVKLEPVLIRDLASKDATEHYDLIVTPLFHFAEILEAIGDESKILELNFGASSKTLRQIATLSPDRVITVAATNSGGAERIAGLVHTVFRGTVELYLDEVDRINNLDRFDVLVYVNALQLADHDIERANTAIQIDWQLEGSSADLLRNRLQGLRSSPNLDLLDGDQPLGAVPAH
ncbi:MAG: GntR family transcriptional regulator [Acidimicrobiales bacterium]